jgi:nucleoid-associated protein YgaU
MALAKATIEIIDPDKAAIDAGRGVISPIIVQYNPTELSFDKKSQIAEIAIPGLDSPIQQFVRGQTERLTVELFFDVTDGGLGESSKDVRTLTDPLYQLVKIQPTTHASPRIRFTWGHGLSMKAIVDGVTRKFTLFSPLGIPLRATVTLSLREYKTLEEQLADLKLASPDHTKTRAVKRGDTLAQISGEEYDDPTLWRLIANANPAIAANPLRLVPGTVLTIPALDARGNPMGPGT